MKSEHNSAHRKQSWKEARRRIRDVVTGNCDQEGSTLGWLFSDFTSKTSGEGTVAPVMMGRRQPVVLVEG